jgi:hypothetical protein
VDKQESLLQGELFLEPVQPLKDHPEGVQPGKTTKFKLVLQNKGPGVSPAGEVFVQFGLAKPLENQADSVLFHTEKAAVPALASGEKKEVIFSTTHQLPCLFDFVRNDWLLREYQAIFAFDRQEKVVAILPLTFSAYYYPGVQREMQTSLPTGENKNK